MFLFLHYRSFSYIGLNFT